MPDSTRKTDALKLADTVSSLNTADAMTFVPWRDQVLMAEVLLSINMDLQASRERERELVEAIEGAEHTASCGANHCSGCGYTPYMCLCRNIGNTYKPRQCNCFKAVLAPKEKV